MIRNRSIGAAGVLLAGAFFLSAAGCGSKEPGKPGDSGATNGGKPAAVELPELSGDVTLSVVDWEGMQTKIAEHKGKVVVVDFWANYCEPCMEQFPNLVKLQRMHLKDVACLSLNMNYGGGKDAEPTDEQKSQAMEFLKKSGAKIPNFMSSVPDEDLGGMLGITLPAVQVYDREGELIETFVIDKEKFGGNGDFTYDKHIIPFVEKHIAGGAT